MDPAIHINKGESLESALAKILGVHEVQSFEKGFFAHKSSASPQSQGLNTAQGFDPQTMKVQERRPKENEGAWQMAQRYCERSGCLIELSDSRNRVALAQPSYEQAPQFFVERSKLASNAAYSNVIGAQMREDYSQVPTVYVATGRGFSVPGQASKALAKEARIFGENSLTPVGNSRRVREILELDAAPRIYQGRIKPSQRVPLKGALYRPRFVESQWSRSQEEHNKLTIKEVSAALKNVLVLDYEFPHFFQLPSEGTPGGVFVYDSVVNVQDEIFGIHQDMYCASRTLSYSQGLGPSAQLQLILPYSYTL